LSAKNARHKLTSAHIEEGEKMPILQINFKLNVSLTEYQEICDSVAQTITDIPGLLWKIWLLNEQENEAGGYYLFRDEQSLVDYLSGPIVSWVKTAPQLREVCAKRFDTMQELTAMTRGPIPALATA
jgi:hypothetical protein